MSKLDAKRCHAMKMASINNTLESYFSLIIPEPHATRANATARFHSSCLNKS
jgi:hypothetical protein